MNDADVWVASPLQRRQALAFHAGCNSPDTPKIAVTRVTKDLGTEGSGYGHKAQNLLRERPLIFDAEGLTGDDPHAIGRGDPFDHRLNKGFAQNIGLALNNRDRLANAIRLWKQKLQEMCDTCHRSFGKRKDEYEGYSVRIRW